MGVNYTFSERIFTEARLGTDILAEDSYVELVATYVLDNNESYDLYAGLGGTTGFRSGGVLPIGINIYPFEKKNFGFHTELAYLILEKSEIIRGSFGIRYRFLNK